LRVIIIRNIKTSLYAKTVSFKENAWFGNLGNAMKATIYHNPACGTSRKTLAILKETAGVDLTVIEYLKNPPSRSTLKQLYERAGITPRDGLRIMGSPAEELGLTADGVSNDVILDAMAKEPILINRPLVETERGVRLCRPQDVVLEIL
jgi:arsenate reductase (glutaredoxin)